MSLPSGIKKMILKELAKNNVGLTNLELSEALGLTRQQVNDSLRESIGNGYVEKGENLGIEGINYTITEKGLLFIGIKLKSPLEQNVKTPVEIIQPAPIVEKSPLEQKLGHPVLNKIKVEKVKSNTTEKADLVIKKPARKSIAEIGEDLSKGIERMAQSLKPVIYSEAYMNAYDNEMSDLIDKKLASDIPPDLRHKPLSDFSRNEIDNFKNGLKPEQQDAGAHYRYRYKGINLDPFRIAQIYGITDFAMQTALKKILCAGSRGHKNLLQDLVDIKCAIDRKIEMMNEDEAA